MCIILSLLGMSLPRLGARSTHLPKPPAHTRPVALYGSCLIRQVHLERDLLGLHHGRATRIQTRAVPLPQVRAKNTNSHPTGYLTEYPTEYLTGYLTEQKYTHIPLPQVRAKTYCVELTSY